MAFLFIATSALPRTASADSEGYKLGPGDKIRVTVFGEPYLSGEFNVNANGTVSLPLIEPVPVAGITLSETEGLIKQKLAAGFMEDPKVSVDILSYRPFFIMGEVSNPGSFPYMADMTVLHAVAVAGGFTPRAAKKKIFIQRGTQSAIPAQNNTVVQPGDIITVEERFF
ncbi:polysaccharide biosynthesis/export family protein [Thiocystis violacea]|uniref:polysaccharide biosynthesis/export family protein n=1 Tax=Thiocystis violacea TaxID=13725 RepID=UPI001904C95A|nr:polysaccharide biosynthesis/export family protein [Thiocystis violacea]